MNKEENANNNEHLKILASCHSFLGELLIEDERNEDALTEFNKALEIQNKCTSGIIKCRQRAFNHFMACLAAQFCDKDEDAEKHCNVALQGLSERICELLKGFECTEEFKENNDYQQVIKVAEDLMADTEKFDDTKKESEDGKEMKELVGVMGDLCAKLEEVKEIIQLKKDGKYGNAAPAPGPGTSSFDDKLAVDPLQAFLSGLTSKYGINEEQLAAMDAEDGNKGDDENKNTSNKNVVNGVTTIGFGNVEPVNDDEVNDLDVCVKRKKDDKKEKKSVITGKKRSMEDAEIDDGMEDVNGAAKRMKLNSGDAAAINDKDGK